MCACRGTAGFAHASRAGGRGEDIIRFGLGEHHWEGRTGPEWWDRVACASKSTMASFAVPRVGVLEDRRRPEADWSRPAR